MEHERLERWQALVYLVAVAAGLTLGNAWPGMQDLQWAVWPVLAALLYVTFTQIRPGELRRALAAPRLLAAAVAGNFVVVPIFVWGVSTWVPFDPAVQVGLVMVLLVPCTDWFTAFSHLGKADTTRAVVLTPLQLALQLALLPLFLWLILGRDIVVNLVGREILLAFVGLVMLPLLAALATRRLLYRLPGIGQRLSVAPIPLLAVVMSLVAATQVHAVRGEVANMGRAAATFVLFLAAVLPLALGLAKMFRLPVGQARVLAFTLGTRNSFVVLPLALAFPEPLQLASVVIVVQSLVELVGMIAYLRIVPGWLFPSR